MQRLHERVSDLRRQLLLNLQPPGEDIHDARNFRKPDHFPVGNVGNVRLADEGQKMMLAHRIKLDVLHENDLARVRSENRLVNDGVEILAITVGQKLVGFRRPDRSLEQTFALRILTDRFQNFAEG